jgi:hypothetical protein
MNLFWVLPAVALAAVLQLVAAAAGLPALLRPDFGLLFAGAAMAFAPKEFVVFLLFAIGLQGDLLASARLGQYTLAVLAAGTLMLGTRRDLIRGGGKAAWFSVTALTFLSHLFYGWLSRLLDSPVQTDGWSHCWRITLAATLWAWPTALLLRGILGRLGLMTFEAKEVWEIEREKAVRKRRDKRFKAALRSR